MRHIRDGSLPGRGVGSCARLRQGSWCGWETSSTSLPASLSQPRPIPPNPVSRQALARSASPRDTSSCRSLLRDGWYTTYAGRQLCLSPLHTSTTASQVLSGYPTKLLSSPRYSHVLLASTRLISQHILDITSHPVAVPQPPAHPVGNARYLPSPPSHRTQDAHHHASTHCSGLGRPHCPCRRSDMVQLQPHTTKRLSSRFGSRKDRQHRLLV